MTTPMEWADPPPDRRGLRWTGIAAKLRQEPGRWAKIGTAGAGHPATAARVRNGQGEFVPPGAFEAITRTVPGHKTPDLYVRFVGENGEHR